jgi:hypothetical protein
MWVSQLQEALQLSNRLTMVPRRKTAEWLKTIPKYHTGGACRPNSRDRETLQGAGRNLTLDDKKHCVAEAKTGGGCGSTDLMTCLEMARDARSLKSQNQQKQD